MRISAKGRYAFAALIEIARQAKAGEAVSAACISEKLKISKIFLEQTFAALKKYGIIQSTKGAKGGYLLAREARMISALDVLSAVESTLLEKADATAAEQSPSTEAALRDGLFGKLDKAIESCLSAITIQDLAEQADRQNSEQAFMMYM